MDEQMQQMLDSFQQAYDSGTVNQLPEDVKPLYQAAVREGLVKTRVPTSAMAIGAAMNFPSSAAGMVEDVAQAVLNPIETAKSVVDLGAGIFRVLYPNISQVTGLGSQEQEQLAREVGKYYAGRYGGVNQFKMAFMQDPAGVLSDASTALRGGAGVLPSRFRPKVIEIADAVEPMNVLSGAARGIRTGVKTGLGATTGVGSRAIEEAYAAGAEGGARATQFTENMRGNVPQTDVIDAAKSNIQRLRQAMQNRYRSDMNLIRQDATQLSFNDVDTAINEGVRRTSFKAQTVNSAAADKVQEASDIINEWRALDPAEYHTPEGMDALKQKVGSVLESIDPQRQRQAYGAVKGIYDGIWKTIQNQSPAYAGIMKDYAQMSDLLLEMNRTLSLNPKASIDTQLRKLQSAIRNNVNTNFGERARLVEQLEAGGEPIMPALAGQSMAEFAPRGIQRGTLGIGTIGSYSAGGIPAAIGYGAISSPRLVGETAYAMGAAPRIAREAAGNMMDVSGRYLASTPPQIQAMLSGIVPQVTAAGQSARTLAVDPLTRNILFQAEQVRERNR
jgi:hypothetical protein